MVCNMLVVPEETLTSRSIGTGGANGSWDEYREDCCPVSSNSSALFHVSYPTSEGAGKYPGLLIRFGHSTMSKSRDARMLSGTSKDESCRESFRSRMHPSS